MPQLYHFVAEPFKENLLLGGHGQAQHMVAGRLCQYLKSWQLEGLRFLYRNFEKSEGCILNDESGLGKVVTVTTFLGSILTNDTTKKCLIVVRDEAAIEEWRFHLGVLTHLTVKVIERTNDINYETVFLIKWSVLKNINIDKFTFNHVIIDNRGEMLNNKFCTGILLRYFENKTTIIISSVDVTSDIKLLHILLRLCARLDKQLIDAKAFEEKFQLPQLKEGVSNKVDLEDYFVKRERVINFCREFRLRRYCHQFDEEFPIVSRNIFRRHIEQWKNQQRNSLSSGSVKLMSSSSEKDTEELFKEYFQVKQERDDVARLDYEVQQINDNQRSVINHREDEDNSSDDVVVMSPLFLVSESESDDDRTQKQNERNSQFIEEIKDDVEEEETKRRGEEDRPNRRKSKKPVKTPPSAISKAHLDESKSLRSRTLMSPKKPLPIRTNSRKSLETDRAKQNKDNNKAKRLRKSNEKPSEKAPKILEAKNHEEDISKDRKPEVSSKQKDSTPSESIKETQPIRRTARVKLRAFCSKKSKEQHKLKAVTSEKEIEMTEASNDKPKDNRNTDENPDKSKHLKVVFSKATKNTMAIMLAEAQKFVTNKNIGRSSRKSSEKTKSRSKKPELPQLIIENDSSRKKLPQPSPKPTQTSPKSTADKSPATPKPIADKSAATSKPTEDKSPETPKQTADKSPATPKATADKSPATPKTVAVKSKPTEDKSPETPKSTADKSSATPKPMANKSPATSKLHSKRKFTELAPIGVHSISTRRMQRQTRSNPQLTTSKYMKVTVAQVAGVGKHKTTPKAKKNHSQATKSTTTKTPSTQNKRPPTPPRRTKAPSPTPSAISASPAESIQLGQALTPTNTFVVPEVIAPPPSNFSYHFPLMLDKETSDSECQIASQTANNHEVIVLTGSSSNDREMEPPKSTVSRRKAISHKQPMVVIPRPMFDKAKSPDLFSTCSDLSLPCSQQQTNKSSHFEGFKIFGSELRQPPKQQQRSCLDILERMLEPRSGIIAGKKTTPTTQEKPKTTSHCIDDEDAMFEITANGTFGNTLRVNSNGEMSPIRNKNQSTPPPSTAKPKNRITNYLISNSQHTSILGQQLPSSLDDVNDLLPKTPKRRKSLSGGSQKRSPRSLSGGGAGISSGKSSQSTKLTQWLVKNSNGKSTESSPVKQPPTKRRRLDLSFPDK